MQHNKDNPFLGAHPPPTSAGQPQVVSKKQSGWNPFEDTVSFGAVTEDFIFGKMTKSENVTSRRSAGAEFDRMRVGGSGAAAAQTVPPKRPDPFGSAPFAAQEKHC